MTRRLPDGVDVARPNVARIYDYLLGGKDNFAADRAAAEQLLTSIPDVAVSARANRSFIGRVVRFLAQAGIRQFLDLGGGLPTQENVHEMARRIAPDARTVYVDNDPVVWSHGQALLASGDQVAMVLADLCEPAEVLRHPDVLRNLDFTQPVAVLCTSTLHFIDEDADPYRIIAAYRDRLVPGSYLAITHATIEYDPKDDAAKATSVYRQASSQLHLRTLAEVLRLFDGFELVDPGLVWTTEWRPDPEALPIGAGRTMRGAVGRKP